MHATDSHVYIDSYEDAKSLAAKIQQSPWVNFDTETTGLDPHTSEIRLMQFGLPEGDRIQGYIVDTFKVPPSVFREALTNTKLIGHNLSFDLKMLLSNNIKATNVFDTMVGAKVVEAGMRHMVGRHNLADVAQRFIGVEIDKTQQRSDWSGVLSDEQLHYAALDVQHPMNIARVINAKAQSEGMDAVMQLEMRTVPVTAWMEFRGLHVDEQVINQMRVKYAKLVEERDAVVRAMMGMRTVSRTKKERILKEEREAMAAAMMKPVKEIPQWRAYTVEEQEHWNLNSGQQLMEWMRTNGITVPTKKDKDKDGNFVMKPTVDADSLEQMNHPFAEALVAFRRANRALENYIEPLLTWRNPVTSNVHCSLDQCKDSGRYSASRPPLQQIPRNADLRSMFVPDPSHLMIISDYSQIELVLIAMMSRDPVMCDLFKQGADLHAHTASQLFGYNFIPKSDPRRKRWENGENFDDATPWQTASPGRSIAKNFNFGSWYGAWVDTLGKIIRKSGASMDPDRIEAALKTMHKNHPAITAYFEQVTAKAIQQGYSETIIGRRRYYLKPRNRAEAKAVSLEANNTTIQGSGADMNKAGLIEVYEAGLDLRMTIHDEVIVITPPESAVQNAELVQRCMVAGAQKVVDRAKCPIDRDVPIKAETKVGPSWAEK